MAQTSFAHEFSQRHPGLELRQSPGRGWGVFTTVARARGEVLMREQAMISIPPGGTCLPGLLSAFASFDEEEKATYMRLYNAHATSGSPRNETVRQIFRTNAFGCNKEGWRLYNDISRINHSCAPNCVQGWSEDEGWGEAMAVEDIPAGAEITISYIALEAEQMDKIGHRHVMLNGMWEFVCGCPRCERERIVSKGENG
ncbi:SET domain-containing protein [Saccharata proteae CBS 121410]|uniref:SET domain-containing protein n=1 Tax=Saccharata proteae CBS 121410 TaxID=1314787 RepID=A0A9P4HWN8_9PEZI|nr:SET domain-containing protein [Saccharata proteae CBS 121410]